MSFQGTPFEVSSTMRDDGHMVISTKDASRIPDGLRIGMTVYLTTEPPTLQPRTSDMQDLVDRCEKKAKPGQGWTKCYSEDDGSTYIRDGKRTVCIVPASWWLDSDTEEERNAELRERREAYFRNVPLLVNAQRMFDLLRRLRWSSYEDQNTARIDAEQLVNEIKTHQWEPETPKG